MEPTQRCSIHWRVPAYHIQHGISILQEKDRLDQSDMFQETGRDLRKKHLYKGGRIAIIGNLDQQKYQTDESCAEAYMHYEIMHLLIRPMILSYHLDRGNRWSNGI